MGIEGEPVPSPQLSAWCPGTPAGSGDILLNTSTLLSCVAHIIHAHFSAITVLAKCDHIAHGFGRKMHKHNVIIRS